MKAFLRSFGILFCVMFLLLPFAVHADAAEKPTVIYVCDSGDNEADGLTPETAVRYLSTAYDKLDLTKDCTVVVCGEFTQSGNFARASSAKSITLTSVYGGVDYRESGAVYKVNGNRFGLADDTTFENITFETAGGSFLLVAQHHAVTVGEGVEMRNFDGSTPGKAFWVVGGFQWNFGGCAGPKYMNTSKATNVTVLSGNDIIVVGGARDFSTVNGVKSSNACTYGDVNVHIGGTAQVSTLYAGAYAAAYTTVGNVNAEIFGNATVGNIYGAYVHNTTASNVTLLWVGGEVGAFSMAQTNGVGLKTASGGTVALEATEDVQATANYEAVAAKFTTTSTHTHSHDDVVVTREATCIEDGEMTYFCTGCSDSFTEPIPATGEHTYKSEVTKEATCVEAGEMTHTCTGCGDSYTEAIPATGEHTYTSEVTKEATCVEAGEMTYTCTVCGATKTEEIPALKAALTQKSISAATNTTSGDSTMRFIAALEVADGVTVEKIGTYISLVALGEDGTPSTEGARVAVKEQAVTDAAPATFAVDLTGIPADQAGTSVFAWAYAVLSDGTRVTVAFDAATVNALVSVQ